MKKPFITISVYVFLFVHSHAQADFLEDGSSRALQMAKRVVSQENPSLVYQLGNRCVQNTKKRWQAVNNKEEEDSNAIE